MATRPVTGEPGWGTIYDAYEDISHNADGTLRLIGSEADGQAVPITTGFQFFAIDGVSTKVYTKYVTGITDNDDATSVTHGVATGLTKILSVVASVFNDTVNQINVYDFDKAPDSGTIGFRLKWDASSVLFSGVQSGNQGQAYTIKIDYIL